MPLAVQLRRGQSAKLKAGLSSNQGFSKTVSGPNSRRWVGSHHDGTDTVSGPRPQQPNPPIG